MDGRWWTQRKFWLGMACSAVFVFLTFRNVHWSELGEALLAVDWALLSAAIGLLIVNLVARGFRWRALLAPLGPVKPSVTFAYINIGYLGNAVLPLRAGEIIRVVLLARKVRFSKSAVLATVVVERVLDVLSLVTLTLLLMLVMPIPPLVKKSALAAAGLAGLAVVGLWWAHGRASGIAAQDPGAPPGFDRISRLAGDRLGPLIARVGELGRSFTGGLAALRSPRLSGLAIGNSALAWALSLGSTWLILRACHVEVPWTAALMVIVVINFGVAIPSSPGFIGVMHFLAVVALEPWEVERSVALGFAVVFHATAFLVSTALGAACLAYEGVEVGSLTEISKEPA
jgi:uncharacterized protein (TIRG00374 family)